MARQLPEAAEDRPPPHSLRTRLLHLEVTVDQVQEAVAVLRREPTELGPPVDAALGFLLARTGHQDEAHQLLKRLLEGTPPAPAYLVAEVFAGLGDASATMKYLERAYAEHSGWVVFLKSEHFWDSMRGDPRFQAFLRRVSLD